MVVSVEEFARLALSMPDAIAGEHQGHADFRCAGRVFASLHPDGEQAMVKIPPGAQQALVSADPAAFSPASGAWGRAGCTMLQLHRVDVDVVREAITEAWQFAMAAVAQKRRKR